ncbi:MAG: hypothetical protein EOO39_27970, partial [Cytophagaceae bacterium]
MKRKTWVVGALLVAMAGLSSCASTERLIYGNNENSREDIVQRDSRSNQNSRGRRSYDNDEGGIFSRRNRDRDDDRMSRNDSRDSQENSSYRNPYRSDDRMSYRSDNSDRPNRMSGGDSYNNPYSSRSYDRQDSYNDRDRDNDN